MYSWERKEVKRFSERNVVFMSAVCHTAAVEESSGARASDSAADPPSVDQGILASWQHELSELARDYGSDSTLDLAFLVFLRRMARFGYFVYGPITIDVRMIEDLVERTAPRGQSLPPGPEGYRHVYADDYVRFTRKLAEELRRSGRRRIDELHVLLAFMRVGEGLPSRVFSELGATAEQVEAFARSGAPSGTSAPAPPETLYSPEDAAEYLGVHVQTVRGWIRSGRLRASRLAGQRALRIRHSDLLAVLEPIEPGESGWTG